MHNKRMIHIVSLLSFWISIFFYGLLDNALRHQKQWKNLQKKSLKFKDTISISNTTQKRRICNGCIDYMQYHVILGPQLEQSRSEDLDLLIVVSSSYNADSAHRRDVIRRTWANKSFYSQFKTKNFFVLGKFQLFCVYRNEHFLNISFFLP